jgi:hypothetical protein
MSKVLDYGAAKYTRRPPCDCSITQVRDEDTDKVSHTVGCASWNVVSGRDNWKKGANWMEFLGSGMRHLVSFIGGEDNDPESGLSHLAHAAVNMLFVLDYKLGKYGTDDR